MLQRAMARRLWIACARRQRVYETAAVLSRLEFTADRTFVGRACKLLAIESCPRRVGVTNARSGRAKQKLI